MPNPSRRARFASLGALAALAPLAGAQTLTVATHYPPKTSRC